MHRSTRRGSAVVGRGCSVVGRGSTEVGRGTTRVHARWRRPGVGSRGLALSLSVGGGGGCCGSSSLLLHLLSCLHLCVFELLHVERLALSEQLLPLELQLHRHEKNL